MSGTFVHPTAVVEHGATLGDGTAVPELRLSVPSGDDGGTLR